jgi:RHS repeat-associated protein
MVYTVDTEGGWSTLASWHGSGAGPFGLEGSGFRANFMQNIAQIGASPEAYRFPIARELRSSTTSYYQADGLGSVTSLSNAAGSIANTYTYDSFGKLTASTGSLVNPFQYTARESDSETGLYYYRARYYDQASGRFIREDPIGFRGGLNFYSYARNNPNIFIDPSGLNLKRYDPKPKENTIICNDHHLDIQLGNLGSPLEKACLEECTRTHEASHLKDMMKYPISATICKGQANGVIVGFSTTPEHDASEVAASTAEIACLEAKKDHGCKGCFQIIMDAIGAAEDYRKSFQH